MNELPEAEVYNAGLRYWPYRQSLGYVMTRFLKLASHGAQVLDMMCGPGFLLSEIATARPDLVLTGVDLDERYVAHGRQLCPSADFQVGDILTWRPANQFDMVLCTGAVHHIPYDKQPDAIRQLAVLTRPGGHAIISDCYIDYYMGEMSRKLGAAKLGYEYLIATIRNGAPDKVIQWTVDIMANDVQKFEYKDYLGNRLPVLEKYFGEVKTHKTWPTTGLDWPNKEPDYGDYVHVCTR